MYIQSIDPLGNITLAALSAALPIVFFFLALIVFKVRGYIAGFMTMVVAVVLAVMVYQMPLVMAIMSAIHGCIYGFFPIGWIVIGATFLYNMTVEAGQFEVIKKSISVISDDRRIQVLLICFCFGTFLEGAGGFGAPVAITAAMMVGLGYRPYLAALLALLANTTPAAFGGLGIPVMVAAQVTGIDGGDITKMLAIIIPIFGIVIPTYLVAAVAGLRGVLGILPLLGVCILSFVFAFSLTSWYLGPVLPAIVGPIVCLACITIFLKIWQPAKIWRFANDPPPVVMKEKLALKEVLLAWSPFIILTIIVVCWGLKPVAALLNSATLFLTIPFIHGQIVSISTGQPMAMTYAFGWLSAAGTAIVIAGFITAYVQHVSIDRTGHVFAGTLRQLKPTLLVIGAVLGYAYVSNNSGMIATLGYFISMSGPWFPLFACSVAWIGTFITGSDTSSNALFGKLQTTVFEAVGSSGLLGISGSLAGGGVGKMIAPQSIAIAAAVTGLVGKESEIYKLSLKHSLILLSFVSIYVYLLSGPLAFLIPSYSEIMEKVSMDAMSMYPLGGALLVGTGILLFIFAYFLRRYKI